jgi:CubicO group peptidase (beta-lactamase class C family)
VGVPSRVVEAADASGFSGIASSNGESPGDRWMLVRGLADRAHSVPVALGTRFGIASGSKAFTALTVIALVSDGRLSLNTPAREVLGSDLPLIDDAVTVEHLLAHRSGIGDYLDEDVVVAITDYVMTVPVHRLATTEDFIAVLDGHPQVSTPGQRFAYNNGGYVVLALLAERASGVAFHELVRQRVFDPAGMAGAAYLRNDELPGDVAIGYLFADGLRNNALHLPVRGSGDGGAHVGLTDIDAFWQALFAGAIVPLDVVAEMTRPRSATPSDRLQCGLGFWLTPDGAVELEGYDAGVSFRSTHDPADRRTRTVVSNWSDGAWPICRALEG